MTSNTNLLNDADLEIVAGGGTSITLLSSPIQVPHIRPQDILSKEQVQSLGIMPTFPIPRSLP